MSGRTEPTQTEGSDGLVILSAAKDHLATLAPLKKILRCAQDDTGAIARHNDAKRWFGLQMWYIVLLINQGIGVPCHIQ